MPGKVRILCVGKDERLLRTRCAVLFRCGYDPRYALYEDAQELMLHETFELIIISASLTNEECEHTLAAIRGRTSTIVLKGLTLAPDLLAEIERHLASPQGTAN
jgi:hypothetical protein